MNFPHFALSSLFSSISPSIPSKPSIHRPSHTYGKGGLRGKRSIMRHCVTHYLNSVTQYLDSVTQYLDSVTQYLDSVTQYLNSVTQYLNSVTQYLDSVTQYPDSVTHYLTKVSLFVVIWIHVY